MSWWTGDRAGVVVGGWWFECDVSRKCLCDDGGLMYVMVVDDRNEKGGLACGGGVGCNGWTCVPAVLVCGVLQ